MARPFKPRFVTGEPRVDFFKPRGIPMHDLEQECLTVEELEAIRLVDIDGLYQEDAAERMEISRPTFQRVLKSARGKVARCLVGGKALGIDGGNYVMGGDTRTFECISCGSSWDQPFGRGGRACETSCPKCGEMTVRRACTLHKSSGNPRGPGGCRAQDEQKDGSACAARRKEST